MLEAHTRGESGEGDGDVAAGRVGIGDQRPRRPVHPAGRGGPWCAFRREHPAVLHRPQLRKPAVLVDPEQQIATAATPPSGETSCGATHLNGPSARMRTALAGSSRCSSQRLTAVATWRPSSAAPSAVSTGCSRLPTANTPGLLVRRPASTTGPRVAGSIASPPVRASSWSGIQSPVNTTVSHSIGGAPTAVDVLDHRAAHPVLTVDADEPAAGEHRPVHQNPARHAERRIGLGVRIAADHSDCGATGFAQCQHRRPAHQFGADDQTRDYRRWRGADARGSATARWCTPRRGGRRESAARAGAVPARRSPAPRRRP